MGVVDQSKLELSERAKELMGNALVWDDHMCMPLRPEDESFLPELQRLKRAGLDVVSLNIGFDVMPWENAIKLVATMRRWVLHRPDEYVLIESVADIERARAENKLGVTFDLEGGVALDDHLPMVQLYYDLGVRWMLFAYNLNNSLGGGCKDDDPGLTDFGREVVKEMERVGMVICCSHTGYRTTMDIMEMATNPVVFSHSNPLSLKDHYRNIRDDAMQACAKTGGVVAINGIGDFLGDNDNRTETMVRHVDYAVQLLGAEHVGIGTDFVFDEQELTDFLKNHPETFDPEKYSGGFAMVQPEQIAEVADNLLGMNYAEQDVQKILGENHLRVARQVWQ